MQEYHRLKELVTRLPPMTEDQRIEQRLDFVYGNLVCSTNHRPVRAAFATIAKSMGWSAERFEKWAAERAWRAI
jgi:hypothetical protein